MKKIFLLIVFTLLVNSGCLKTRAQMKNPTDYSKSPVQGQVNAVAPEQSYALDEIKSELIQLNGRMGDIERKQILGEQQIDGKQSLNQKVSDLDNRVVAIEQTQMNILAALNKLKLSVKKTDPVSLFHQGRVAYKKKQYNDAIQALSQYLGTKDGKHIQDATYIRAHSYFSVKKFKKAIIDYSKFPEKFTRSRHLPSSLLYIGLSFEKLGMKDDARAFYQELLQKFPKSTEAKQARSKIK